MNYFIKILSDQIIFTLNRIKHILNNYQSNRNNIKFCLFEYFLMIIAIYNKTTILNDYLDLLQIKHYF